MILFGLIGPGFWKISAPNFYPITNLDSKSTFDLKNINLNSLKLDQKFLNTALSSNDLFGREIAIAWSNQIVKKAINDKIIPRTYISQLPNDLNTYHRKQRKKLFISIVLPLLVRGNELIMIERKILKNLFKNKEFKKIKHFCIKYKINKKECLNTKTPLLKEKLLMRVDVLPISMMLAQAAIESGWGLSRFAKQGNALFGQWVWGDKESGIKPKEAKNSNFYVKSFHNLQSSVNGYLLNLNSHYAYEKMRQYRKLIKIKSKNFSGKNFAKYLDKYAEIGFEYVNKIITLINVNNLEIYNNISFEKNSL